MARGRGGRDARGEAVAILPHAPARIVLPYHHVMRARLRVAAPVAAAALLLVVSPAAAHESFHYHWTLDGFVGALASIFIPSRGEGVLSYEPIAGGRERGELLVTSRHSGNDEYFRYGSVWEPATRRTISASSDLVWRRETKSKHADLEGENLIDVVSAIQLLRREPPTNALRLEIWSDGRLYPVVVLPRERARRKLPGGEVEAQRYSVHGVPLPDRKLWKGELDIWIAADASATPVEIVVSRSGARVRLVLDAAQPSSATSPTGAMP